MRRVILDQLRADRGAKRPVALATTLKTGAQRLLYADDAAARAALRADKPATVESPEGPVFVNPFNPPLRLIVVGAVHIAQSLAPVAALAGYEVHVIDPRQAFGSEQRFPGVSLSNDWPDAAMAALRPDSRTAVVTLTHDPKLDDPALAAALRSDCFYIGALGSKRTHEKRLQRLRELGFGDSDFARIHGPVGLDIGARSPAEIAVAIMAQVTGVLRRAPG